MSLSLGQPLAPNSTAAPLANAVKLWSQRPSGMPLDAKTKVAVHNSETDAMTSVAGKKNVRMKCSLGITCVGLSCVVCFPRPPNVRACHRSVVSDLISGRSDEEGPLVIRAMTV